MKTLLPVDAVNRRLCDDAKLYNEALGQAENTATFLQRTQRFTRNTASSRVFAGAISSENTATEPPHGLVSSGCDA